MQIKYIFLPKKNVQVQIKDEATHEIVHTEKIHFTSKPTFQVIASIERTLSQKCNTETASRECYDRTLATR